MANTEEQLLTLITTLLNTGYVRVVNDPAGTPDSSVITLANFVNTVVSNDNKIRRVYYGKTAAPTADDDTADGYLIGDHWIDETNDKEYVCLDNSLAAAVWTETTAAGGAGGAYWTTVPGTPTRASNTQFTITDTGGSSGYASLFAKGMVLKWTQSGTKQAMVISSSYAANVVTINIVGDVLAAGFTDMKYGAEKARSIVFGLAGTVSATGTDVTNVYFAPFDMKVFSSDIYLGTAGNGTTTVDINDDGTTVFTTKPSITTTGTSDIDNTADSGTVIAQGSKISCDLDAVAATPGVDLYAYLFYAPNANQYLT